MYPGVQLLLYRVTLAVPETSQNYLGQILSPLLGRYQCTAESRILLTFELFNFTVGLFKLMGLCEGTGFEAFLFVAIHF